jgi:hypothetical protein
MTKSTYPDTTVQTRAKDTIINKLPLLSLETIKLLRVHTMALGVLVKRLS